MIIVIVSCPTSDVQMPTKWLFGKLWLWKQFLFLRCWSCTRYFYERLHTISGSEFGGINIYEHIHIYIYINVYMYIHLFVYIYICTYICIYLYSLHAISGSEALLSDLIYVIYVISLYVRTHVYKYTYIYKLVLWFIHTIGIL
jgi:hypothetical protein